MYAAWFESSRLPRSPVAWVPVCALTTDGSPKVAVCEVRPHYQTLTAVPAPPLFASVRLTTERDDQRDEVVNSQPFTALGQASPKQSSPVRGPRGQRNMRATRRMMEEGCGAKPTSLRARLRIFSTGSARSSQSASTSNKPASTRVSTHFNAVSVGISKVRRGHEPAGVLSLDPPKLDPDVQVPSAAPASPVCDSSGQTPARMLVTWLRAVPSATYRRWWHDLRARRPAHATRRARGECLARVAVPSRVPGPRSGFELPPEKLRGREVSPDRIDVYTAK